MYIIYNERRKKQLIDEYGEKVEFHYRWTADLYYSKHCSNMKDVIIKEDNCKCIEPLTQFEFNTEYCKRCDKLIIKETV